MNVHVSQCHCLMSFFMKDTFIKSLSTKYRYWDTTIPVYILERIQDRAVAIVSGVCTADQSPPRLALNAKDCSCCGGQVGPPSPRIDCPYGKQCCGSSTCLQLLLLEGVLELLLPEPMRRLCDKLLWIWTPAAPAN
ncbi:hypothetical protein BS78_K253500 [Paspalum vaginatum]|uniref:Uncharacterized protein n=1 Tax=Paspalum vaginatum TaxID=158149 RepID=A0A9W7X7D4_9POAL|nr:hypothetical protein BS78_K253500 [Paspalum vaginatum]